MDNRAPREDLDEAHGVEDLADAADDLDDDVEPRGLDDDSGYGPDSYFAHAMEKDD